MSSSWPEARRAGLVGAVAARAEAWLFEPAAPRAQPAEPVAPRRPVIAVVGLGPRCGATTVARALAVELARRDALGAAAVTCDGGGPGAALATGAARRLARTLGAHATGRLALVAAADSGLREIALGRQAPLVLDAGHGRAPEAALALADRAVLVASPDVEPALAEVAAVALSRDGPPPLVVLNRAAEADGWREEPDVVVGESRLGARLAHAGRDALGALGAAAAVLADACAEAVSVR